MCYYIVSIRGLVSWECTCKCLLAAGDDDRADVLVIVVIAECFVQLGEEWAAEGVQGLGSVESD